MSRSNLRYSKSSYSRVERKLKYFHRQDREERETRIYCNVNGSHKDDWTYVWGKENRTFWKRYTTKKQRRYFNTFVDLGLEELAIAWEELLYEQHKDLEEMLHEYHHATAYDNEYWEDRLDYYLDFAA